MQHSAASWSGDCWSWTPLFRSHRGGLWHQLLLECPDALPYNVRGPISRQVPIARHTCRSDHGRPAELLWGCKAIRSVLVDFCFTSESLPPDEAGSPPRKAFLLNAPCACACRWAEPHRARTSMDAILLKIKARHQQANAVMERANRLHIRLIEQCPRCWSGVALSRRRDVHTSRDHAPSLYAAVQHASELVEM